MGTMNKASGFSVDEVNAPYSKQLGGPALAQWLSDLELAKQVAGHVSSSLERFPLVPQTECATESGIALDALEVFASEFSARAGESDKLMSRCRSPAYPKQRAIAHNQPINYMTIVVICLERSR